MFKDLQEENKKSVNHIVYGAPLMLNAYLQPLYEKVSHKTIWDLVFKNQEILVLSF